MKRIKKIVSDRRVIVTASIIVVAALCIIPFAIKSHNDGLKRAQVESVGITLIKSELDVYYQNHAEYPTTLRDLLNDSQVSESGGTATTLKVLPYFNSLRYNVRADHKAYSMTYTGYDGELKVVTGAPSAATR